MSNLSRVTLLTSYSTPNVYREFSDNLQNFWESVCCGIIFSKVTREIFTLYNFVENYHINWYVPKNSSSTNFEKSTGSNFNKNELLIKFLKGFLKMSENILEDLCSLVFFNELQANKLQPSALCVLKVSENSWITSVVELFFRTRRR